MMPRYGLSRWVQARADRGTRGLAQGPNAPRSRSAPRRITRPSRHSE